MIMKFRIDATSVPIGMYYDNHEQLLKEFPCLSKFGLEVVEEEANCSGQWIRDENNHRIWQPSDKKRIFYTPYVTIDTVEQLVELIAAVDYPIVVTSDAIEIYDTYRE